MLRPFTLASAFLVAFPLFALPLSAQTATILPGLGDVAGVASNDILNVRAEPNAEAQILGTLPHNGKGVEVTGFDASGKWARVNMGEVAGWASARFLRLRADTWKADQLPASLSCHGTEPFWSLRHEGEGMTFTTPESAPRTLELRKVMDRGLASDATRALIAGDSAGRVTAVIQPEMCSDGMSDRQFGLATTVILDGNGPSQMLSGCCSIAAR